MKYIRTALLAAAIVAGTTGMGSAQTDSHGNSNGSEHVGNFDNVPNGGAMSEGTVGTAGINTRRSEQDSPNGSPDTPPTSKEGPRGDPSRDEDAPK
jgi:hypothetical protein